MNRTKIDWPGLTHTFNPVTGCKRGCKWGEGGCYAKKNWDRLHRKREGCEFEEIRFHPERMDDFLWLGRQKEPLTIFVGSMSDIEWWERSTTIAILNEIQHYPKHTFMFLSKSPLVYSEYAWPANTMQGLTLTCEQTFYLQEKMIDEILQRPRPFLSIEPLLGKLRVDLAARELFEFGFKTFETVIVGAMTGAGKIKPQPEWIQSIKDNVPAEKIYWKKNIQEYL